MANEFDDLFNGGLDSKMDFLMSKKQQQTTTVFTELTLANVRTKRKDGDQ